MAYDPGLAQTLRDALAGLPIEEKKMFGGLAFLFRSSTAPDPTGTPTPPLFWRATYPLVESLRSRLVILEKRSVGQGVPRGTF